MPRPTASQLMLIPALLGVMWIAGIQAQEAGHGPPPPSPLHGDRRPPPRLPPPPPPRGPYPPSENQSSVSAPSATPAVDTELDSAYASLEAARRGSDTEALTTALQRTAALLDARGRTRESLPLLREALGLADRAQDERLAQQIATLLAAAHGRVGDAEQAVLWRQRADEYRDRFSSRLLKPTPIAQISAPALTPVQAPAAPSDADANTPAASRDDTAATSGASMWPWVGTGLGVLLLLSWWRTKKRAAALEAQARQLQRRQQHAQTLNARLQAESDQLRRQAVQDTLTGALTRHAFAGALKDLLGHASHYGRPVALLVMDLDHFKSINDQYGHLSGDTALKLVVGIARENLGSGDLLGRFGGDEFLIAAIDHDPTMALALGESIRKSVAQRAGAMPALAPLRVSIGIAHATPASGYDLEPLFQRADAALYAAKRAGRDRVALESERDPAPPAPSLRQLSAARRRQYRNHLKTTDPRTR